jgi:hypothetical protein
MTPCPDPGGGDQPRSVLPVLAAVVVAVLYSWATSRLTPLTWPATLATVLPGLVVCGIALLRPPTRCSAPRRWGVAALMPWVVLAVLVCGWQLYAFVQDSRIAHPTLSALASPLFATSAERRMVGYLLWLAAGAWLVRR